MYSKQETFDTVVAHLRKQGKRAKVHEKDACRYRAGVLKCAAGCLIPDDKYNPSMELNTIPLKAPATYGEMLLRNFFKKRHDIPLVRALQIIHDTHDVESWEEHFKDTAKLHNLEYKEPVNA